MITSNKTMYEEIPSEPLHQTLFVDHDELNITGYKNNLLKEWIFYIFNLPVCGAGILLLKWYPQYIYLKCVKSSLENADTVLVKDLNGIYSIHSVCKLKIITDENQSFHKSLLSILKINNDLKYFIHKELRYIWLCSEMQFSQLRGWCDEKKFIKDLLEKSSGYTAEEQAVLLKIYGHNEIKVVNESCWKIFCEEILRPFYLFQIFAIILWVVNDYMCYAVCVIVLSSWSIILTVFSTKKQKKSIENLVHKTVAHTVPVVRKNGNIEKVSSSCLVPGDVIHIPQDGCMMPCDAVLLCGNCLVNESTLTGESCPVMKTAPTDFKEVINPIIFKNHILFCGTRVLQTRYYGEGMVTALTINTGFSTVKGELIRCLINPKPLGFKLYEDSVIFIFYLFIAGSCGIFYLVYISLLRKVVMRTVILDSLDLITIIVPPSLPAALSTAVTYSKSRLMSKGIFCISPPKINLFGKLKLMCFDKTGTLTEEGLDLCGVIPCIKKKFQKIIEGPWILEPKHPLVVAFATCHSLTKINGKLSGDPLDLSMFNSLDWEIIEPGRDTYRYDLLCPAVVKPRFYDTSKTFCEKNFIAGNLNDMEFPYEIGIVREFPFTSSSRCMSVITRELGSNHMNLYCKGAPEKIHDLCLSETVPENFNHQLQIYAIMGFRVLGLAYQQFDQKFTWKKSQRVKRHDVEKNLIFLGFIIMQNKLKQVSSAVISELKEANIRCVMVTGDNLYTALSVSRECSMVLPKDNVLEVKVSFSREDENVPKLSFQPLETTNRFSQSVRSKFSSDSSKVDIFSPLCHYALDGNTWEMLRTHFKDSIPQIIVKGTIFARMLPEQKTQLIQAFQDLDYIVGMCGDGANDFGAMKAAHVGVSLSETENSAAAPFTSKVSDISCVVTLVQEGRCALVSTFIIFKYMAIYGLIQFTSVIIAYSKGVSFSNVEFLYVDFVVTSLLAVVIGRTGPAKILVKRRPSARLISFGNLLPLMLQVALLFFVQFLALEFLHKQKWFVPVVPTSDSVTVCWENSVIYCISLFQFLILALVYSKATPYRRPFYKDVVFMVVFTSLTIFSILLCVYPFRRLAKFFELIPVEDDNISQSLFRIELLFFPLINLVLSLLIELFTSDKRWSKKLIHFITKKKISKNRYKRILLN